MTLRTTVAVALTALIALPTVALADHHKRKYYSSYHSKPRVHVETSVNRAGLGGKSIINANYENNKQPVFYVYRERKHFGGIRVLKPGRPDWR